MLGYTHVEQANRYHVMTKTSNYASALEACFEYVGREAVELWLDASVGHACKSAEAVLLGLARSGFFSVVIVRDDGRVTITETE